MILLLSAVKEWLAYFLLPAIIAHKGLDNTFEKMKNKISMAFKMAREQAVYLWEQKKISTKLARVRDADIDISYVSFI